MDPECHRNLHSEKRDLNERYALRRVDFADGRHHQIPHVRLWKTGPMAIQMSKCRHRKCDVDQRVVNLAVIFDIDAHASKQSAFETCDSTHCSLPSQAIARSSMPLSCPTEVWYLPVRHSPFHTETAIKLALASTDLAEKIQGQLNSDNSHEFSDLVT